MVTVALLLISNTFMTFAWYGHLKHRSTPVVEAFPLSWLIALGEYYLGEPVRWNYAVSFLFIVGAVVFAFWGRT